MTDEELNARFALMTSAVAQVAQTQAACQEQVTRSIARMEENQDQLTQTVIRLEATIERLDRGQAELRRLTLETRGDMAQLTDWTEAMTRAVEVLTANQQAMSQGQAESDQRFEVLLQEIRHLIRQQQQRPEDKDSSSS